jgi:hypothetical protein
MVAPAIRSRRTGNRSIERFATRVICALGQRACRAGLDRFFRPLPLQSVPGTANRTARNPARNGNECDKANHGAPMPRAGSMAARVSVVNR